MANKKYLFLEDYDWCKDHFGESTAKNILKQVKEYSNSHDINDLEPGDKVVLERFTLFVTGGDEKRIMVMFEKVNGMEEEYEDAMESGLEDW